MFRSALTLATFLLATQAMAQEPTVAWQALYNGPGNHQDVAFRIARGVGGVFVLGTSATSNSNVDVSLLKYTPQGALVWARQYGGPSGSDDRPSGLVLDGAGGAFVCGHSRIGTGRTAALLHYDAAGNLLWLRNIGTPQPIDFERGPQLARTADGDLRIALTSAGNFFVAAFDELGTQLWKREIDVVPGAVDYLTGLAVDSVGNTIVTGPVGDGFGGYETIQLDPEGNILWRDTELGDFGNTLGPSFVAIDDDGEIVVSGTPESSCGVPESSTWRISPDGARLWTRTFPPVFCDSADMVDMALDGEGNALVLCHLMTLTDETSFHMTTLEYDRDGNELWRRDISTPGPNIPVALDVDRDGNAYVAGVGGLTPLTLAGVVASYSPDGAQRWFRIFGEGEPLDWPADVAVGPQGDVYLGAVVAAPSGWADMLTVRLQQP